MNDISLVREESELLTEEHVPHPRDVLFDEKQVLLVKEEAVLLPVVAGID